MVLIRGRVKFGVLRKNGRQEAASHPSALIGWNVDLTPCAHLGFLALFDGGDRIVATRRSHGKSLTEGVAARAWEQALSEHPNDQPDSAELGRTFVCNTVLLAFNPPDDDVGYESIITDAIEAAARFIEAQPCSCPPDPLEDGPCDRCAVLGRAGNEPIAR